MCIKQMLFVFLLFFPVVAFVCWFDTEFQKIYPILIKWSQGYHGRAIALGLFLMFMSIGIIKKSLMVIVVGIVVGFLVNYMPIIIKVCKIIF